MRTFKSLIAGLFLLSGAAASAQPGMIDVPPGYQPMPENYPPPPKAADPAGTRA